MELSKRQVDILNATLEIITEKSLDAVSIRNIAAKVGVTEPAIYRHFKSKEDLILKLACFFRKNWEAIVAKMSNPTLSGLGELEFLLNSIISKFAQDEVYPSFFSSIEKIASTDEVKAEIASLFSLASRVLDKVVRRGQAEGNIRSDLTAAQLVQVILNMLMSLVFYWKLGLEHYSLTHEWQESWNILKVFFKPLV